jgi:hypothetical protein
MTKGTYDVHPREQKAYMHARWRECPRAEAQILIGLGVDGS